MSTSPERPPDEVVDRDDAGDETAKRFQYQYAYAATMCTLLLADSTGIVAVFCEHHEDVLLKHSDGRFTGIQVKTRANDQPVWKTSDEPVRKAFSRFAKLENRFPGQFREFEFATNHPCHRANNGSSIGFVLSEVARAADLASATSVVAREVRKISALAGLPDAVVFSALKKTRLNQELPKIDDANLRLEKALAVRVAGAEALPGRALSRIATELRRECADASALQGVGELTGAFLGEIEDVDHQVIMIKRFDKARVDAIVDAFAQEPPLLAGDPALVDPPGTASAELLDAKLRAGGLSEVLLMAAKNLRDKAEYQGASDYQKFGTEGLARHDHLLTIAQSEAALAFESARVAGDPFGPRMLAELERRFKECVRSRNDLFARPAEHLLGLAYVLTAKCTVRWSEAKPWERS